MHGAEEATARTGRGARAGAHRGAHRGALLSLLSFLVLLGGAAVHAGFTCGEESTPTPADRGVPRHPDAGLRGVDAALPVELSDDPAHWIVDSKVHYRPELSEPRWVVPATELPAEVRPLAGNNNVDLELFQGRLYVAFRTSESHFASRNARLVIVSAPWMSHTGEFTLSSGSPWRLEHEVKLGADVREPRLLRVGAQLMLYFFEAGTNPLAFEPKHMRRSTRLREQQWSESEIVGQPGEVPWNLKVRGGVAYLTSYLGNHYAEGTSDLSVRFQRSKDGLSFGAVDPARLVVYQGGVSEVAFEFDARGDLWAVTRNEDGDASGFGSHLCTAPAANLGVWSCPAKADPERYDSPQMFRHGQDLYLLARRDLGGPFDQGLTDLPFAEQKKKYLVDYSLRPKRTALYRVDTVARKIVHLRDLPSAGDNAFPAVRRTGAHTFLVANYTSPLDKTDWSWLQGQAAPEGTQIYLVTLTFVPEK
ncbi:MAG: hypothetical protein IT371_09350 [Deltaproteobacteria bacterium]|nr:hypothetical protein [Deltaproteobacteria bacterium]